MKFRRLPIAMEEKAIVIFWQGRHQWPRIYLVTKKIKLKNPEGFALRTDPLGRFDPYAVIQGVSGQKNIGVGKQAAMAGFIKGLEAAGYKVIFRLSGGQIPGAKFKAEQIEPISFFIGLAYANGEWDAVKERLGHFLPEYRYWVLWESGAHYLAHPPTVQNPDIWLRA